MKTRVPWWTAVTTLTTLTLTPVCVVPTKMRQRVVGSRRLRFRASDDHGRCTCKSVLRHGTLIHGRPSLFCFPRPNSHQYHCYITIRLAPHHSKVSPIQPRGDVRIGREQWQLQFIATCQTLHCPRECAGRRHSKVRFFSHRLLNECLELRLPFRRSRFHGLITLITILTGCANFTAMTEVVQGALLQGEQSQQLDRGR